jgi:hypothetical protein
VIQPIGRWSTRGSVDGKKEGGKQGDMPEGKHGGGGSIHDWQWVKESLLGSFDSCGSPFVFLVVFVLFRCK